MLIKISVHDKIVFAHCFRKKSCSWFDFSLNYIVETESEKDIEPCFYLVRTPSIMSITQDLAYSKYLFLVANFNSQVLVLLMSKATLKACEVQDLNENVHGLIFISTLCI